MKIKFKKDGLQGDNLKLVEDLEKRFEELPDSIAKDQIELQIREALKPIEGVDFAKMKEMLGDDEKGIRSILKKQGEELTKLQNEGKQSFEDMSVRSQVAKWVNDNKETIEAIRAGQNRALPPMQIRAAATMTNTTVNAGSSVYLPNSGAIQGGVNDLNRNKPTFWNRLTKGRTKLNPYVWVNKTNKQGNAQFIGEGVLKPLASFDLSVESSVPKKVAERMKASTELLYDIDGMTSLIENELRYEVEMAANTATLTGTASSTSPAGITTLASAFTLTTVETTEPNNLDAIRAAIAQLKTLNYDRDIVAFINPIDAANMDLAKASDGHYILPPFTTSDGQSLKGITIIEDNNIAVGNLLIGDMSKYKILMYQDFFIQWGWENDDFSKNLVTVIGEMRFHQFFGANDAGAFIYDAFADIKTAIAAA
jgi:hypothetical protein